MARADDFEFYAIWYSENSVRGSRRAKIGEMFLTLLCYESRGILYHTFKVMLNFSFKKSNKHYVNSSCFTESPALY